MKKMYTILSCILLGAMLLVGWISILDRDATYSESERRTLRSMLPLTVSGLLDGSFFEAYGLYFADTFPGRETLKQSNTALNGFYYFGGLSDEENTAIILDFQTNGANQGEALHETAVTEPETQPPTQPLQTEPEEIAPTETLPPETVPPETEPDLPPEQTEPNARPEQLGAVLQVGDSAFDVPYGNADRLKNYTQAANAIADTLGDAVQTFWMPVPNSAEFYTHEQYHTGSTSQKDMFQLCRDNLNDNVTYVDAYTPLRWHTDEYIYFRTDHHWTQLGSYYAYTAFCETIGAEPVELDQLETGKWTGFVGSLYTYTADYPQAKVLKNNPDTVYYWKPSVNCEANVYSDTTLSDPYPVQVISSIGKSTSNKYLTFMSGDHALAVVETDAEGPGILVIKESYGNALIPWLTHHYSKIVIIDPREYFADNDDINLVEFVEAQGLEQCLIINYPMMLNSKGYTAHLQNLTK